MSRRPRNLLVVAVLLALAAGPLAACGKKGPPELPEGTTDQFPRQYPVPEEI
jgi:predicted small lipoprotein YifL